MRRKMAAGNWKMNGLTNALDEIAALRPAATNDGPEIVICPPATLIHRACAAARGSTIAIGGQDCHAQPAGAHTGDIAPAMLVDAGATHVILGHSERRQDHGETDKIVRLKTKAAWAAGLKVILCVGETEEERDASNTLDIIRGQLAGSIPGDSTAQNLVVAYEPVWAIGTGRTPTLDQIAEVHDFIRDEVTRRFCDEIGGGIRLLYGGSVKPDNAAEIFQVSNVDGGLVGGASLKAADFARIIAAF